MAPKMAPAKKNIYSMIFVSIVAMYASRNVVAYPTGAPKKACAAAAPQHHTREGDVIKPHEGPSPYSFTVDSTEYKIGQTITVTIMGSQTFGGFLIQARRVEGSSDPVGNFTQTSLPSNAQLRGCKSSDDGVTHTDPESKLPGMKFEWSTKEAVGPIMFYGTVAQDHDVFWTEIKSPVVQQSSGSSKVHLKFEAIEEEFHRFEDKTIIWKSILRNKTMAMENVFRKHRRQDD